LWRKGSSPSESKREYDLPGGCLERGEGDKDGLKGSSLKKPDYQTLKSMICLLGGRSLTGKVFGLGHYSGSTCVEE